jgi:hypothetical protein
MALVFCAVNAQSWEISMTRPARAPRGSAALAHRLRELREAGLGGRPVTQRQLGEALGHGKPLSAAAISAYEREVDPSPPPIQRLRDYATFFVTERSLANSHGRLVPDDDLTDDERVTRDALLAELVALADADVPRAAPRLLRPPAPRPGIWSFPVGDPVRLICGRLKNMEHPYANRLNRNHTELLTYADLDALMELYAHVWKLNPTCDVRFLHGDELTDPDDFSSHLIVIGGSGLNPAIELVLKQSNLPLHQRGNTSDVPDGDVFDLDNGDPPILPIVSDNAELGLIEDVGLLARLANPYNVARTLTVCSGIYSRGVLGAVRTLSDARVSEQNEAYLAKRFHDAPEFALLMRVPVQRGKAITPDLQNESVRLYEWPDADTRDDPSNSAAGHGE